jgi:hypothetical protein
MSSFSPVVVAIVKEGIGCPTLVRVSKVSPADGGF